MIKDYLLPVGLYLDIDFKPYPGLIDHKLFFHLVTCSKQDQADIALTKQD